METTTALDSKINLYFLATESLKLGNRTSIKDEEILQTTEKRETMF